jgi:hypothetical protein
MRSPFATPPARPTLRGRALRAPRPQSPDGPGFGALRRVRGALPALRATGDASPTVRGGCRSVLKRRTGWVLVPCAGGGVRFVRWLGRWRLRGDSPPTFGREVPPRLCARTRRSMRHRRRHLGDTVCGDTPAPPPPAVTAPCGACPLGVPNPMVRGVGFTVSATSGRHALIRPGGDAPGCPRRGRAHAPRVRFLRTRTCEPRGDHPTAAPTPTTDMACRHARPPSPSGV